MRCPHVAGRWGATRAVSRSAYVADLPSLIDEIDTGNIKISARPVPLADVEVTWIAPEVPGMRTVFVPEAGSLGALAARHRGTAGLRT